MSLRVLSLSTLFPSARRPGFGLFVARQAAAVARRGDVELVVVNPPPGFPQPVHRIVREFSYGVEVHRPRFARLPLVGWRWNPALVARAVLPLARRLHAERPFDLVDAQFFYPDGPAAARVARALGLPLTIKARGSDIHLWGQRPAALRQMLSAAGQAVGLLAVSAGLKRDMAALGMPEDRIVVHYTGLDHGLFHVRPQQEARAALAPDIPVDGPLLACVGNLIPLKGQDLAIAALAQMPEARLALAGRGETGPALRAQAESLGVADRVHFLGGLEPERLAVLLAAADAMVLPSEREGLANAWIEALACGARLAIPDVGGAREVVTGPAAGRLVARDPDAIATALGEMLAEPVPRDDVAACAAGFSWDANAEQLAAFWRAAAGRQTTT